MGGLAFQLTEIKRRNGDLKRRTQTVNGRIHDLKAPLNSTLMVLKQLQNMVSEKMVKNTIQINASIVRRMIWHIEEILQTVSKKPTQLILNKSVIQMPALAEGVKAELDILYGKKPHTIIIKNDLPENIQIKADSLYIENVLCNLMENALKYSDDSVKVRVHLQICDNNLKVSVKDNGWGIPLKYRKRIFKDFFRVKRQDKQSVQGYGIGLGRVQSIIWAHKGSIILTCPEDGGSIFTFQIPLF